MNGVHRVNTATLKIQKGHQGSSFESADKDVFYNCNAAAAKLTDGDNWEYIYVKAYVGQKLIGTDTAKVNVKKHKVAPFIKEKIYEHSRPGYQITRNKYFNYHKFTGYEE